MRKCALALIMLCGALTTCYGKQLEFIKIEHIGATGKPVYCTILSFKNLYPYVQHKDSFQEEFVVSSDIYTAILNHIRNYNYGNEKMYMQYGIFKISINSISASGEITETQKYYLSSRPVSLLFFKDLYKEMVKEGCDADLLTYVNERLIRVLDY